MELSKGVVVLFLEVGLLGGLFYPVKLLLEGVGLVFQGDDFGATSIALTMDLLLLPADHRALIDLYEKKFEQRVKLVSVRCSQGVFVVGVLCSGASVISLCRAKKKRLTLGWHSISESSEISRSSHFE